MISVVIPTLNAGATLAPTLAALVPAAVDGLVREVIIADGGSSDATLKIADMMGADVVKAAAGRGSQLSAGAAQARASWLLFLHADTVLEASWLGETSEFVDRVDAGRRAFSAAVYRFRLDDDRLAARIVERGVGLRTRLFGLPYGDQGLLVPRRLYEAVGGYAALPIMEDVDIVRRLGRRRIHVMRAAAITSPDRFQQDGYTRRIVRNLSCLALYYLRVPPPAIARLYEPRAEQA